MASADEIVTDVDLLPDGRSAVVGVMRISKSMENRYKLPIQVSVLDLGSGTQRKLFEVPSWQAGVSVVDSQILYASLDRMKLASIESGQLIREFVVEKSGPQERDFCEQEVARALWTRTTCLRSRECHRQENEARSQSRPMRMVRW